MPILNIPHDELNLDYTLQSGQTFRWRKSYDGWWTGVVHGSVIRIRTSAQGFEWKTYPTTNTRLVSDYFRLDDDIPAIYASISTSDAHVAGLVRQFRGLRLVRQEPTETLLSFICSAVNSIPRISAAIEELSRKYGRRAATIDGVDYFAFPKTKILAEASDLEQTAGLCFRGRSLKNVAQQLTERPADWLESLSEETYETAVSQLLTIKGVGRKIADCVCLFALNKDEAVPVDTHVRQLTARLYQPRIGAKTVTPSLYERIADCLRRRFGQYAGWAQQFLYYEDIQRVY